MEIVHKPVMGEEALRYLAPEGGGGLFIDGTLGEGGHSALFLERFPGLAVWGLDADEAIQAKARNRLSHFGERMHFFSGWYDDFFADYPLEQRPDRILFDFGISIFHYVESGRGFSFSRDEPLDMRLRDDVGPPVSQLLQRWSEEELADVIFRFGEERYGRRIARAIKEESGRGEVGGSARLAELIWHAVPADYRYGRIHPATRTFQALRIAANRELERIERALVGAYSVLTVGGVMGVISFHSLEDRLVKHFFKDLCRECVCPPEQMRCTCGRKPRAEALTKKPVEASEAECVDNPPSRSAKFRFVKKRREDA